MPTEEPHDLLISWPAQKALAMSRPSRILDPRRLLTSGERSGRDTPSRALGVLFKQSAGLIKAPNFMEQSLRVPTDAPGDESIIIRETAMLTQTGPAPSESKPLTHEEKIAKLIELIASKRTPKLRGRIKVELSTKPLNYQVKRNGAAIIIKTSILPNDKRFAENLQKFSRAAARIIEHRPFDCPPPRMTPDEKRGWDGLLGLGAHRSKGGTAIDIRSCILSTVKDKTQFLHFWTLAVRPEGANTRVVNRDGDPIGVWTKERLS